MALSLAYWYVALAAMLAEINYVSDQLDLPLKRPVLAGEIHKPFVGPPRALGFRGSIVTEGYFFGFGEQGIFCIRKNSLGKNNLDYHLGIAERQEKWARLKSQITTNEAYKLARAWLVAMDVDVVTLEREQPPRVEQWFFYPDSREFNDPPELRRRKTMLPAYDVRWGTNIVAASKEQSFENPFIEVTVFGPTKDLIGLEQENMRYSRRPKEIVKDYEKLLAIPDEEFNKYTPAQKSNLVAHHLAITYPPPKKDGPK